MEEMEELEETKKKTSIFRIIVEIIIYIALILICIFVIPKYVVQRTIVDGQSMMNTLHDEDNLIVEKVSYRFSNPDRFDIVVFYPYGKEEDPEDYYVKRIIGLPGETIQIIDSDIYINGEILEENYGRVPITSAGVAREPLTLGEDEFFVLGDNRGASEDSRDFGPVEKSDISGQVVLRIYPFKRFGLMTNK